MNTSSTYSSTASLLSQKASTTRHQQPQPKNYEAAFGSLASSYGFPGAAPSLPTKSQSQSKPAPKSSKPSQAPAPAKNYEAAFGGLSSSYGLGGGVPSLPRKL
ncbi:hypothetical protein BD779DRAFT_1546039 [Infundibulicybe gibba]|nr:hypothetical protein BD779DRAFT_1546039 [Infundibulicybe gibba]